MGAPYLVLLFATGCSSASGQLIVEVDSDLAVPAELGQVEVTLASVAGEPLDGHTFASPTLPFSFGVAGTGEASRVRLTALGRGPAGLVERRAELDLPRSEVRLLRLFLHRDCLARTCSVDGETCGPGGGCGPAAIALADLPVIAPGDEADGGRPDPLADGGDADRPAPTDSSEDGPDGGAEDGHLAEAGRDAAERDAGPDGGEDVGGIDAADGGDATPDAARDAGPDGGRDAAADGGDAGPIACTLDVTCPGFPGQICEARVCVESCVGRPSQCPPASSCNPATGRCESEIQRCGSDSACGPPAEVCEAMTCVPGCASASGLTCDAESERCAASTGRCVAGAENHAPCAADADCASSLCLDIGGDEGKRCASVCVTGEACPTDASCAGFGSFRFCADKSIFTNATFASAAGASCTSGLECRSGLCRGGVCTQQCGASRDCVSGGCFLAQSGDVRYEACGAGLGAGGARIACGEDGNCNSGVCEVGLCRPLCRTHHDCAPAEICAMLDRSVCTFDLGGCIEAEYATVYACVPGLRGIRLEGASCTLGSDCDSGRCLDGRCLTTCGDDEDCSPGRYCRPVENGTYGPAGAEATRREPSCVPLLP